ncbi:unnamed protein product [Adineta ricciae]|uniref:Uncharacterized protein n=1 Tax=Adineta ricciae TaxID=249248 RepID=A0A815UGK4_ADIRI|nr:unnamed protein product [Adineta ricciae]
MGNSKSTSCKSTQQTVGNANNTGGCQCIDIQRIQEVLLVWLDANIDNNNDDVQNTITLLRRAVNDVNTYTDNDKCIQFVKSIENRKACMIISGSLGQLIVPQIHELSQVDSIFIFRGNKRRHKRWTKDWPKIKGIFTEIKPICKALKQLRGIWQKVGPTGSFFYVYTAHQGDTVNHQVRQQTHSGLCQVLP